MILESNAQNEGEYWYGRIFPHCYVIDCGGSGYHLNLNVDIQTGKITRLAVSTRGANYSDIVPDGMTVGLCCAMLAEYWGFGGYTILGDDGTRRISCSRTLPVRAISRCSLPATRAASPCMIQLEGSRRARRSRSSSAQTTSSADKKKNITHPRRNSPSGVVLRKELKMLT